MGPYDEYDRYRPIMGLCSEIKQELALNEEIDLDDRDDTRWAHHVDHILEDLFIVQPEHVVKEERGFAHYLRNEMTWREGACAALMWRLHNQAMMLLAFLLLLIHDLVDISCTRGEIDFENPEWHTYHVQLAISNFEFIRKLRNPPTIAICDSYTAPLTWLACMIVRATSVNKLEPIIELLESTGVFGEFDHEAFRKRWPVGTMLCKKPLTMWLDPTISRGPKQLGFYLPMGILSKPRTQEVIAEVFERRLNSWDLCTKYFKLDTEEAPPPTNEVWW